jgi:hypothetical protein
MFVSAGRAEWPRNVAKPKPLPGVPGYDYRPADSKPAPTVTAVSLAKIDVTPAPPAGKERRKATLVYQLQETRMQADHCFLSRVAVALNEDGSYQISFRADQNPQPGNDIRSPLKPGEQLNLPLQTSQLKRNTFVVKVRGYAAAQVGQGKVNLAPAAPVLIEFPTMVFVVERGVPASKFYSEMTGPTSAVVEKYFPLIDRIEVEFTYK